MRKISPDLDNPVDNAILQFLVEPTHSIFRKLNFTPNVITILSLIAGIYSAYYLYMKNFALSSLMFAVAYYLDCMDGFYARQYNMETEFGDFLDHISDIFKVVALLWVMFKLDKKKATYITIFILVLGSASTLHLGCQQKYYENDNINELFLNNSKKFCLDKNWIHFTRYFGTGTFTFAVCLILLFWNKF